MRGGHRGRGRMGPRNNIGRVFVPHIPFDVVLCEAAFPRVKAPVNDDEFTQALIQRNQELTATAEDQTTVLAHITKVTNALDALVVSPPSDLDLVIEEHRQVGSFKKGTMMVGNVVADIAVIFKSMPTKELVIKLAEKIVEQIKVTSPECDFVIENTNAGFKLISKESKVNVLIGTTGANIRKLVADTHIDQKFVQATLAAIRHVRWFEEHASHSSVKVLVRLLKDMSKRFEGFSPLTPWIIDLLAHHCVMTTSSRQPLPVNEAFRRCLRLLSAGFFLPGSAGIVDPCETGHVRVHTVMSLDQQDKVCYTAQTLLRVLSHGGYKKVIGIENDVTITTHISVYNDVVITPSERAYEKSKDDSVNNSNVTNEAMDTTESGV